MKAIRTGRPEMVKLELRAETEEERRELARFYLSLIRNKMAMLTVTSLRPMRRGQ